MGRNHFANYAKNQPKEYQAFSDNMWNGFVSITHAIGLNGFTYTPPTSGGLRSDQEISRDQKIDHSSFYK
jgi:hypothetical protein